jgi:hypothetical protein
MSIIFKKQHQWWKKQQTANVGWEYSFFFFSGGSMAVTITVIGKSKEDCTRHSFDTKIEDPLEFVIQF